MRNGAIATGDIACVVHRLLSGPFFSWQSATSAGTLPTPSEPERETGFQTVHSTLRIKRHCMCWPLHLGCNGTPPGVSDEATGVWSQCHRVGVTGFQAEVSAQRQVWATIWNRLIVSVKAVAVNCAEWLYLQRRVIEIHLLMILVTARCSFSIIAMWFGGWRYGEISSRVPVVISAAHCSLGQQTASSGGDSPKSGFYASHDASDERIKGKKGVSSLFPFLKLLNPSFYINIWR